MIVSLSLLLLCRLFGEIRVRRLASLRTGSWTWAAINSLAEPIASRNTASFVEVKTHLAHKSHGILTACASALVRP